jgi:cell fate (sporulation/competence/biofilm development) regulator YmcA (YheA/YmcA/DUF963 family)
MMSTILSEHPLRSLVNQFVSRLQACEEVQRFRLAEQQVQKSQTVSQLVEEIKRKQKEWVHAKHYQKTEYMKQLERELDQLQEKLDNLPIVREYQQYQVDVNDLLQLIQKVVIDTISSKIEIDSNPEMPSGCMGGGACGCHK